MRKQAQSNAASPMTNGTQLRGRWSERSPRSPLRVTALLTVGISECLSALSPNAAARNEQSYFPSDRCAGRDESGVLSFRSK